MKNQLPEILFITSYPPRECGIATYSQDLIKSLDNKFGNSFSLKVCALEAGDTHHTYSEEVKYILDTTDSGAYVELSHAINADTNIRFVMLQHEFGFFKTDDESVFSQFLYELAKPVIITFHTVLPRPDETLKIKIRYIAEVCKCIVVMTKNSERILMDDYGIAQTKIVVIPHGTHLVPHLDKESLKEKYNLTGRTILSTFGLLSSGKNIETTLNALPEIIKANPDTLFLVIGKTHPGVVKSEGEKYRELLLAKVEELNLQQHVKFINRYILLPEILEYLQLTDIYLFTSKDPNQAVSGTFSYAISCGCPVISTPIPHAREVLENDAGIIIDFESPKQLSEAVIRLLSDERLRKNISSNCLHRIAPTAWENSAIAHARLFAKTETESIALHYRLPEINLNHVKKMTTDFGMIQFSIINQPDIDSGYTLDDNARALIALCMHFELTGDEEDIAYIGIYFKFIKHCLKAEGYFQNYVDVDKKFTKQNEAANLADSNGRAIWALGFLISKSELLPAKLIASAEKIMQKVLLRTEMMHSTRAMAFAIKGLYYSNLEKKSIDNSGLIKRLANRLVQMYRHESEHNWEWFESYMTYANSILPEALLCAWLETGEAIYKETAKTSFDFLLSLTFNETGIQVISNKSWKHKGQEAEHHGEQPIDVAYTILALSRFYNVFNDTSYLEKMTIAFNWFQGHNHLHRIIYNPCTGGCYDGLEKNHVNLNQGAESTLSYLMARLSVEKHFSVEPAVTPDYIGNVAVNV